jgi:glycosyltransferase involved in cell wall biosynthesis
MRILLAIHNAYSDATSGAARSVRTIMNWLAASGHDCRVLATARFDGVPPDSIEEHVAALDTAIHPVPSSSALASGLPAVRFELNDVPVTMLLTRHNRLDQTDRAESQQFVASVSDVVRQFEPDLLFTYGAHPVVQESMRRARLAGVKTLFTVRRNGYEDPFWFQHADHVLTACPFLQEHYRRTIGLASTGIESPIDWSEVLAPSDSREYVTFVNPSLEKGAAFFVRLADVLGSRRPDIPLLVVESAMDARVLSSFTEVNLAKYPQIMAGPATPWPADFFGLTKVLLVPSLCEEAFGRIAVEAMINEVPPLVSNRGGLSDSVRGAGRVLPVPTWMTPAGRQLPTVSEVEPWYHEICELWDNPACYATAAALAHRTAQQHYSEPLMRRRYLDYFESLSSERNRLRTTTKETADDRCQKTEPQEPPRPVPSATGTAGEPAALGHLRG